MSKHNESIKYAVDEHGRYLGVFDGGDLPPGAIEVFSWPEDARQVMLGDTWIWPKSVQADVAAQRVLSQRAEGLKLANEAIEPLQDAFDIGDATPQQNTLLIAWKRYRVRLNQIEQQPGYPESIDWPARPDEITA